MAIKESKYSKVASAHNRATSILKSIHELKDLPDFLKNEVILLQEKFKQYDLEQHRESLIKVTGNILTEEEAKELLIEASGYKRWKLDNDIDDKPEHYVNLFKDDFNMDVGKEDIKVYMFVRDAHSRDDIWLVRFICIPGHSYVYLDTGRVGYSLDVPVKTSEIQSRLEKEFE